MTISIEKRYFRDKLYRNFCRFSAFVSIAILFTFLFTLAYSGSKAFTSFYFEISLPHENYTDQEIRDFFQQKIISNQELKITTDLNFLFEQKESSFIKKVDNHILGQIPASEDLTSIFWDLEEISDQNKIEIVNYLKKNKEIKKRFDWRLLFYNESIYPEKAGIRNSLIGSLVIIVIALVYSVPVSILTAIYLVEFSKDSLARRFIENNVNNLAAVPSVVYGLLGLWVFINSFNLPRSSAIVGGLTIGTLLLPQLTLITKQALKSVPTNIKNAATAMGANKLQVFFDVSLPFSLPQILTGMVFAIARALGETAPLILLGMTAFIISSPSNLTDPTSTIPTLIYLWSNATEKIFAIKTSGAIIVLLIILLIINIIAFIIRENYKNNARN